MKAQIERPLLNRILKINKINKIDRIRLVQPCKSGLIVLCLLFFFASVAAGQQQPAPSAVAKYFSDVELINQDGQKMRFYSDVLKGKVVIINAFFSTCMSVCPPMNRNLEKIQDALGDRLGKEVFLVSISVDPATDTPTRLKDYSRDRKSTRL